MQQIINEILEGNFDYDAGALDFSCARLELTLQAGTVQEGTFTITSHSGRPTQGFITSSDLRMECLTPNFSGSSDAVAYRFHGEELEEGEVVKGEFYAVSNQGEYSLPFVVTAEHTVLSSSIGSIKNLFHFANLAKTNWTEAVKLFYSPDFYRIFQGSDKRYYDSYRGLSVHPGREQAVEEFLMEIHKKQKVEFYLEESSLRLENPAGVCEEQLTIVRNGWGYTCLKAETEGDFLLVEKEILTDNDFLGNYCHLPVFVDSSRLRRGKNFGRVTLRGAYQTITVPVTVRVGEGIHINKKRQIRREKKRLTVQLMEFYQAFRLKKISGAVWLAETDKLVERMEAMDSRDPAAKLFKAQILITQERYREAEWLLEQARELMENSSQEMTVLQAYYLYLTTLIHGEAAYVDRVTAKVEQIYRHNRTSWRVAWLLLYLSEDYNRSAASRWAFLEKQFDYGSASPILYIEALLMLNNNPAVLRKLGVFELQVLSYGSREEMLSPDLVEQLLYLAGRAKEYSPALYRVLRSCYEKKKDVRILQEICTLLIKGGRTSQRYAEWYRLGVENELRITNLYEYYMLSVDLEAEVRLPKIVLMYFSYQNNLDYEHSAFLYSYVRKHKEEYPQLYENYRERMERFVLEQLQKEHMSRQLAYLYQELLPPEEIDGQNAQALGRLLYTQLIEVQQPQVRRVIVCQPGYLRERAYPVTEGKAWAVIYGNESTLLFEDGEGSRLVKNVEYTTKQLMQPTRFIRHVSPFIQDNIPLDLYLWENPGETEGSEEYIKRCMRLIASQDIQVEIKRELVLNVLQQLYDRDDMRRLDECLEAVPHEQLTARERREVLRLLVLRGRYDIAYDWLRWYGPYFADTRTLVRLLSEVIRQTDFMEDEILTGASLLAFHKGKYDGNILRYLTLYFRGRTREMRDIWKAAKSFETDCYELCGKMLVQMLYTGSFVEEKMEIFRYYVSQGGQNAVEEAFLTQCAYDYFVKDKQAESYVFEEIVRMYQRQETLQKVCGLACLKYYAAKPQERTAENRNILYQLLNGLLREGIHLNFMRSYQEFEELLLPVLDKTIVEYRARPGTIVRIHYVMLRENGEAGEYITEEMHPVYGGVCFKEFILFFGETVQYYLTEERDGREQMTKSGTLQRSDSRDEAGNGRFALLNDIAISRNLQDYDTLDKLLEEYYYKEFMNGHLFTLN